MAKLLRIDQPTGTVMFEDQLILSHDIGARHGFDRRKLVADQLEDQWVARQMKHRHHHAALAGGVHETLGAGLADIL